MNSFKFKQQTGFYKGKVRDVYSISNKYLIMIASNRISAFDVILPRPIPFKGQVLNQIAAYMLNATKDICPNWLISAPAPNVSIGKKCEPFKIEMVVRGNLTGHAWRTYSGGNYSLCGVTMPEGMKENDFFPTPIITPSTKADAGHDEDISAQEIIDKKLATEAEWKTLSNYALQLFARGKEIAARQGLILVDTKYEFGKIGDEIILIDEIHTPDSSRFFYADGPDTCPTVSFRRGYRDEERQQKGVPIPARLCHSGGAIGRPKQLSKEFVREWLIENNFMGKEGQTVPEMSDEWIETISNRYIELYEKIIGLKFVPVELSDDETEKRILDELKKIDPV